MTAPGEKKRRSNLEEPGSALGSSALQSSWIQRLKRAATLHEECDGRMLQIPLKRLAIGRTEERDVGRNQVQEFVSRINIRTEDDSKLFINHPRQKETGRKLSKGKPPLPPSKSPSRAENSGDACKRKLMFVKRLKVHALDIRLEKHHQLHQDSTRPKDLLAEFASRLDIKEKPTPVGLFRVAERRVKLTEKCPHPGLTPVISVHASVSKPGHASSSTASLPRELLGIDSKVEAPSTGSGVGSKRFSLVSVEANASRGSLAGTLSTACCGSSPFPANNNDVKETELLRENDVDEVSLACGKRRLDHSVNLIEEERIVHVNGVVKRSRVCVEGQTRAPPLAGPWLNRWTLRNGSAGGLRKHQVFGDHSRAVGYKGGMLADMETPSAAAMAIVGAAVRRFQSYSLETTREET